MTALTSAITTEIAIASAPAPFTSSTVATVNRSEDRVMSANSLRRKSISRRSSASGIWLRPFPNTTIESSWKSRASSGAWKKLAIPWAPRNTVDATTTAAIVFTVKATWTRRLRPVSCS